MYKTSLSIPADDSVAISYLKEQLAPSLDVSVTEHLTRTTLTLSSSSPKLLKTTVTNAIVDVVISYYKLQYIREQLPTTITPEIVCLLATVVAYRQCEEKNIIAEKINGLSTINIDGLLNFKLVDIAQEWTELGALTKRLLSQCYEGGDVYQLIAFMIGLEKCPQHDVIIDVDDITCNGESVGIYPFFADNTLSLLYSVMLLRPSSITIIAPQKMDERLVQCVKNLGKKPVN